MWYKCITKIDYTWSSLTYLCEEFYVVVVTHTRTFNNQICCTVLKLIHLIYNSKRFSKEWNLIWFDIVILNFIFFRVFGVGLVVSLKLYVTAVEVLKQIWFQRCWTLFLSDLQTKGRLHKCPVCPKASDLSQRKEVSQYLFQTNKHNQINSGTSVQDSWSQVYWVWSPWQLNRVPNWHNLDVHSCQPFSS